MADAPAVRDDVLRHRYRIARGEMGVLTFEPYKSHLLPKWRFRTAEIAEHSSQELYEEFLAYNEAGDFVGMDMTRKFIQMGMTRAKRYANFKGGRKYARGEAKGEKGEQLEKSQGHEGREEKLRASLIFKEVLEKCLKYEGYQEKKKAFLKELKELKEDSKQA